MAHPIRAPSDQLQSLIISIYFLPLLTSAKFSRVSIFHLATAALTSELHANINRSARKTPVLYEKKKKSFFSSSPPWKKAALIPSPIDFSRPTKLSLLTHFDAPPSIITSSLQRWIWKKNVARVLLDEPWAYEKFSASFGEGWKVWLTIESFTTPTLTHTRLPFSSFKLKRRTRVFTKLAFYNCFAVRRRQTAATEHLDRLQSLGHQINHGSRRDSKSQLIYSKPLRNSFGSNFRYPRCIFDSRDAIIVLGMRHTLRKTAPGLNIQERRRCRGKASMYLRDRNFGDPGQLLKPDAVKFLMPRIIRDAARGGSSSSTGVLNIRACISSRTVD